MEKKKKIRTLQEQFTFNEARRGSGQISELMHLVKKRVGIYRKHIYVEMHHFEGGLFFLMIIFD